jgi:hypothetical protein
VATLIGAMRLFTSAPSHLKNVMFPDVITTRGDMCWVDYWRGNSKLAPFVSQYAKGSSVPRERFKSSVFSPPHVKPVRVLTADDMFNRLPGALEVTPDAQMLVDDIADLDRRITRTEEWMCSQVLFTGRCEIEDWDTGNHLAALDYGPFVETFVSVPWDDPAAKPLDDLKACVRAISSGANSIADVIVFGERAADLFEGNESVQLGFDRRFIIPGELQPAQREWGLTTLGTWRGLNLLINATTYSAKDGTTQNFVPPNVVLVACSENRGCMSYAGVAQGDPSTQQLEVNEGTRIPLVWLPENEDIRKVRLSSRPCPIPPDPSNWTVMHVVD